MQKMIVKMRKRAQKRWQTMLKRLKSSVQNRYSRLLIDFQIHYEQHKCQQIDLKNMVHPQQVNQQWATKLLTALKQINPKNEYKQISQSFSIFKEVKQTPNEQEVYEESNDAHYQYPYAKLTHPLTPILKILNYQKTNQMTYHSHQLTSQLPLNLHTIYY